MFVCWNEVGDWVSVSGKSLSGTESFYSKAIHLINRVLQSLSILKPYDLCVQPFQAEGALGTP